MYDIAEQHQMIIHWYSPDCDPDGNSVLIENVRGEVGMIYYNPDNPVESLHFYILNADLYQWAIEEGFSDDDVFEEGDFRVLDKVELEDFCNILCKCEEDDGKRNKVVK